MRINALSLATTAWVGRRRLWWTRRPTAPAGVVPTAPTAQAGQAGRPTRANLAFDPQAPASLLSALRAAPLSVGPALATLLGGRLIAAPRNVMACAGLPGGAAFAGAHHFVCAPSQAPQGTWGATATRPAPILGALLSRRQAGSPALLWPVATRDADALARLGAEWDAQCRAYAAGWALYHEAYLAAAPKPATTTVGARAAKFRLRKSGLATKCISRVAGLTEEDRLAPLWEERPGQARPLPTFRWRF